MPQKNITKIFDEIDDAIFDIARLESTSNLDKALSNCLNLLEKATKYDYLSGQGRIMSKLARIYHLKAEHKRAIEYCLKAIPIVKDINDTDYIAECYVTLGNSYTEIGDYQKALDLHLLTLDNIDIFPNKEFMLMATHVNIGQVYACLGYFDFAIRYFKKAYAVNKNLHNPQAASIILNNIGGIYQSKEQYQKAISYYKRSMSISNKNNMKNQTMLALYNIPSCYINLNEIKKAKYFLKKALKVSDEIGDKAIKINSMLILVELLCKEERYSECKKYLNEAKQIMDVIDDAYILTQYYNNAINYYYLTQDYKSAFDLQKKLSEFEKKQFNEENMNKIASMQAEFEIKQKEKEAEIYRLKNVELVKLNKELQELHDSKDSILRIVSHDLKNLIGTTSQVVELLGYQPLNEKAMKYVSTIDTSTKRAIQLVKDILEAQQIDTIDYKLELSEVILDEYLESMKSMFILACEPKQIDFITDFNTNNAVVALNQDKMWQILNNLIHNAIKFTPKEGKVYLSTEVSASPSLQGGIKGGSILIKIIDTGIGIPADHIPILFDKFTKAKRKGTEGEQTTGIGLSIVKRLVELHNGIITVSSEIGKGTEFCIQLPIVR